MFTTPFSPTPANKKVYRQGNKASSDYAAEIKNKLPNCINNNQHLDLAARE